MKRFFKILSGVVTAVLVVMLGAAALLAFSIVRSPDAVPTVMGYKVLSVISGSMEPAIRTGDVILVRPLEPDAQIQEGDVITFRSQADSNMLITHRVAGIVNIDGQPAAYVTRGDANQAEDLSAVVREQIVGRYEVRLPYLGYVANFVRRPVGIVLLVILPGLMLIGMEIRKMWQILDKQEAAAAKGGGQKSG